MTDQINVEMTVTHLLGNVRDLQEALSTHPDLLAKEYADIALAARQLNRLVVQMQTRELEAAE